MSVFPEGFLMGWRKCSCSDGGSLSGGWKRVECCGYPDLLYKKAAGGGNTNYTRELLKQRIADVQAGKSSSDIIKA